MADSDYRDDRDDRDADRPRRRDDDDRPRKKKGGGLMIVLIILGVVGLLCVGTCGVIGWFGYDVYTKMVGAGDEFLTKVGNGDYTGAYNSTTANYKSKKTLEQFTADMKAAKLDQYQAKSFTPTSSNTVNNTHRMTGPATLKDGTTVTVTLVIDQTPGGFVFTVDDITAPGIGTGSTPSTPPTTGK
jgi:flagellar basal body-associated protein FliL